MEPALIQVDGTGTRLGEDRGRWVDPTDPGELGLAAPVKKLLSGLRQPRQQSML